MNSAGKENYTQTHKTERSHNEATHFKHMVVSHSFVNKVIFKIFLEPKKSDNCMCESYRCTKTRTEAERERT